MPLKKENAQQNVLVLKPQTYECVWQILWNSLWKIIILPCRYNYEIFLKKLSLKTSYTWLRDLKNGVRKYELFQPYKGKTTFEKMMEYSKDGF